MPPAHEAVFHVRVSLCESLGYVGGIAPKQEDRAIGWVGERAAENEFAAFGGLPAELEVDVAELCAAVDVVVRDFVEEQVVHGVAPVESDSTPASFDSNYSDAATLKSCESPEL